MDPKIDLPDFVKEALFRFGVKPASIIGVVSQQERCEVFGTQADPTSDTNPPRLKRARVRFESDIEVEIGEQS